MSNNHYIYCPEINLRDPIASIGCIESDFRSIRKLLMQEVYNEHALAFTRAGIDSIN